MGVRLPHHASPALRLAAWSHGGVKARASPISMVTLPLDTLPWLTLLTSSAAGVAVEGRAGVPGSLVAFALQCLLSNLGVVPSECRAYDQCWLIVLPASLALSVLTAVGIRSSAGGLSGGVKGQTPPLRSRPVFRVFLAFLIGAVGTLLGSALAFVWLRGAGGATPRLLAARLTGAVCATYVGGTVNFFQVGCTSCVGKGAQAGKSGLITFVGKFVAVYPLVVSGSK
jgi:hypothetical protein